MEAASRRLLNLDCKLHPDICEEYNGSVVGQRNTLASLWHLTQKQCWTRRVCAWHILRHIRHCNPVAWIYLHMTYQVEVLFWNISVHISLPLSRVGPIVGILKVYQRSCTGVVLDVYLKKYWWPLIQNCASKCCRLAIKGDVEALLSPSKQGWVPHPGIPEGISGLLQYIFQEYLFDWLWMI